MNNFTKEEWQELRWMLYEAGKGVQPLCYKIQSMIDNYCEHKNYRFDKECFVDVCKDCGVCLK